MKVSRASHGVVHYVRRSVSTESTMLNKNTLTKKFVNHLVFSVKETILPEGITAIRSYIEGLRCRGLVARMTWAAILHLSRFCQKPLCWMFLSRLPAPSDRQTSLERSSLCARHAVT